jgi:cellulase/cellobiase CelA1
MRFPAQQVPWVIIVLLTGLVPIGLAQQAPAVKFQTTSDWGTGFVGQITISNTGSAPISAWALEFEFDRTIDTIWDGTLVTRTGNLYTVKSAGWNDSIAPGGSVSFGFTGSPGDIKSGPANFRLGGTAAAPAPSPEGTQITLTQNSRWVNGFSATLNVTNSGPAALSPWVLTFRFDQTIDSMWNGTFTRAGDVYQVSGFGQTASIPAAAAHPPTRS